MVSVELASMPTIAERENLMAQCLPKMTGFTPRRVEKLSTTRLARTMLNVECNHVLRQSKEESHHGNASLEYRLWLEAGKHKPPYPARPDPSYNSNVWRNFRKTYGFNTSAEGRNITEVIAGMYPLNVPAPSKVSPYTYARFLSETPMIKDAKRKRLAIERIKKDLEDYDRLKLRSALRNPPIDKDGRIVPPINFKKYAHRFIPPSNTEPSSKETNADLRTDMFGNVVTYKAEPYLWKLTYKLNNPQYEKVKEEIKQRQSATKPIKLPRAQIATPENTIEPV